MHELYWCIELKAGSWASVFSCGLVRVRSTGLFLHRILRFFRVLRSYQMAPYRRVDSPKPVQHPALHNECVTK